MADKPNGTSGPHLYLASSSEWDMPADPGAAPTDMTYMPAASMYGASSMEPVEHRTSVPETFVPETTQYKGGGIFVDVTGPAQQTGQGTSNTDLGNPYAPNSAPAPGPNLGSDFGPSSAPPPTMAPPHLAAPPMAAPGMPDIGAPPMGPGAMGPGGIFDPSMGALEQENAHMLGLSVVTVALGAVVGTKYGGLYGGIAGSLFAGAAINAYRALTYFKDGDEESDKEAKVSGTYAVGAAAIGAVLWTKLASKSPTYERNFDRDDDDGYKSVTPNSDCGIRPVGP